MPRRMDLTASATQNLLSAYRRGATYSRKREHAAGLGKRQPKTLHSLPGDKRCLFGKDLFGKQIARALTGRFGMEEKAMQADAKFAEAVETIVSNCGHAAMKAIFSSSPPQKRKAIMGLSRTSDDRQRYRVEGFLAGRFRSIKTQSDDPVFDTIAFSEVPSRLWRARGTLIICQRMLEGPVDSSIAAECCVLAELCLKAAKKLRRFASAHATEVVVVPETLCRDRVQPILDRRDVRGRIVGKARAALKLTIKSVWDYPEMQRRGLPAKPEELEGARQEQDKIITSATAILASHARSISRSGRKYRQSSATSRTAGTKRVAANKR
jgi:hypothetical protein